MKDQNPFLHEFGKAWIKKFQGKALSDADHLMEAGRDFGFLIADGEKKGLPYPVAFELARAHFKRQGKAMMDLADVVTLEMIKPSETGGRG